jgi:hypothetical protein
MQKSQWFIPPAKNKMKNVTNACNGRNQRVLFAACAIMFANYNSQVC